MWLHDFDGDGHEDLVGYLELEPCRESEDHGCAARCEAHLEVSVEPCVEALRAEMRDHSWTSARSPSDPRPGRGGHD